MKIKTIRWHLDAAPNFDKEVNDALNEGWRLTKREVLDGCQLGQDIYQHRMLYAELVRNRSFEEDMDKPMSWSTF